MNFVPQILTELEDAKKLGFVRGGMPVLSMEASETPQVFKAVAVAFAYTVRVYVFESSKWLEGKRLSDVAELGAPVPFIFRAKNLPQEIPAFQHSAHIWGLGVCESTHEVYDKTKALLQTLCEAYRRENPEPILDVPSSKGTYQVWLPCSLQQAFEDEFEKLCKQFAGDYNITIPWKFKETAK